MRHSPKPTTADTTLTLLKCCDPRVAALAQKTEARVIRVPGTVVDPSWIGFKFLTETTGHTVAVLGHSQCLAHKGSDEAALKQVQKARNAFWNIYQNHHNFVVGMIDVATLHVVFWDPHHGKVACTAEMVAKTPVQFRQDMEKLATLNSGRNVASSRSTTFLHHPVGVLALSLDGAMDDVRVEDLVYVIDVIGQPEQVLNEQVRTIGKIVAANASAMGVQPHVLVAGTNNLAAAQLHAEKIKAVAALKGIGDFTTEIVQREMHGQFAVISTSVSQTEPSWRHHQP